MARGELGAVGFDELAAEAEGLVKLDAGDVGGGAEVGVADDVEVGEAGEAEGLGDAAAAGGLDVEDEVGVGARGVEDLRAEVKGTEKGGLVLAAAVERVDALVGGVERGVRLEDDVGLAGEEVSRGGRGGGRWWARPRRRRGRLLGGELLV